MSRRNLGQFGFWTASTFRHKNNIENAVNQPDNSETFWATDADNDHFFSVEFPSAVLLQCLSLYLDFPRDESYTPQVLVFFIGTTKHDMQMLFEYDIKKKQRRANIVLQACWIEIPFPKELKPLFYLRIVIKQNFNEGRDTRLRGIKLY